MNASVRLFVVGFTISLAVSVSLYFALLTMHPPPQIGQPGAPDSVRGWLDEYASWSATTSAYNRAAGWSLLAAFAFAFALGASVRPRLLSALCFVLLNVYFAWTSLLLQFLPNAVYSAITQAVVLQANFLWTVLNLRIYLGVIPAVADLESLGFLIAIVVLTFLSNRSRGKSRSLLVSLKVAGFSLAILGVEIAIFDYKEFFIHVTQLQVSLGFAPWFSNADLLVSAVAMFVLATLALRTQGKELPVLAESNTGTI